MLVANRLLGGGQSNLLLGLLAAQSVRPLIDISCFGDWRALYHRRRVRIGRKLMVCTLGIRFK